MESYNYSFSSITPRCLVTFHRAELVTCDETRSNSKADCIIMWTIKEFNAGQSVWECECGEVRQERRHFIRQQPVGPPGWFMAAILCQNLTTHQSAMKSRLTLALPRDSQHRNSPIVRVRYGKGGGKLSSKAAAQSVHWVLFICSTHQLLFSCSSLIIHH